jgi:hypothetical protein
VLAAEAVADAFQHVVGLGGRHRGEAQRAEGLQEARVALVDEADLLGAEFADERDVAGLDFGQKQAGGPRTVGAVRAGGGQQVDEVVDEQDAAGGLEFVEGVDQQLLPVAGDTAAGREASAADAPDGGILEADRNLVVDDAADRLVDDRRFADAAGADQDGAAFAVAGEGADQRAGGVLAVEGLVERVADLGEGGRGGGAGVGLGVDGDRQAVGVEGAVVGVGETGDGVEAAVGGEGEAEVFGGGVVEVVGVVEGERGGELGEGGGVGGVGRGKLPI